VSNPPWPAHAKYRGGGGSHTDVVLSGNKREGGERLCVVLPQERLKGKTGRDDSSGGGCAKQLTKEGEGGKKLQAVTMESKGEEIIRAGGSRASARDVLH